MCIRGRDKLLKNNEFSFAYPQWDAALQHQETCQNFMGPQFSQFCVSTNIRGKPDILIIGDSIANNFFYGLTEAFPKKNITAIGKGACVPALGLETQMAYHTKRI